MNDQSITNHAFWNQSDWLPQTVADYDALVRLADEKLSPEQRYGLYWLMSRADLYFLLRYVLSTKEYFKPGNGIINPQWIIDRCKDVQTKSDKVVDIWARFHWKSNIKTFANLIRYILIDPDVTILILSHTRPNAKKFMAQVQREILTNDRLRRVSFDQRLGTVIFPAKDRDYTRFSLDEGVIVNRLSNPKEATIEAAGLVDSLPQGPHYKLRCIDDAVTPASVNTPDMKEKTVSMWELSQPLGMPTGDDEEWLTGTFYAYDDCWHSMIDRGYELRLHPCFAIDEDGTERDRNGKITKLAHHLETPVLYNQDRLMQMIRDMGAAEGSKNAAMQMYCDPSAGTMTGLQLDWLNVYETEPKQEAHGKNTYILVDPANEKKERLSKSSYTAMWVVALGQDGNYYIIDGVCDRLNLSERTEAVFRLHRRWKPIEVRYEKFGLQADIEHIEYVQKQEGYRFRVVPVKGITSKKDRIMRLEPLFKAGRFFIPEEMNKRQHDGEKVDLMQMFRQEYAEFPNSSQMDMLDSLSRIAEPDLRLKWPKSNVPEERYGRGERRHRPQRAVSWMAA
jgi:predicted phage terminase large subunit-like protein